MSERDAISAQIAAEGHSPRLNADRFVEYTMSALWATAFVSLLGVGQPLPDQLDVLRNGDTTPQIQLLLDSSCSMGWDPVASVCSYYPLAQNNLIGSFQSSGTWYLSRVDQLKAALTGCRSSNDGILDQWATRALFAIREFGGGRTGIIAPFDPTLSNLSTLEAAVINLPASGGTPLAPGYQKAARYFNQYFNDTNSEPCRQNYIVVMSDGVGNSRSPVPFDFVPGNADIYVSDADYCFGSTSSGCPPEPYLDRAARYLLQTDNGNDADVLLSLSGTQPIRTYAIGFQAPSAADALMRAMAAEGDGEAFTATSYEQLTDAFGQIISDIVTRSRVSFNAGTVQADGLFSGNYLYQSIFRPAGEGHWIGTTKKHCVFPENGLSGCLFFRDTATGDFVVNPAPTDVWTGETTVGADAGGTGAIMLNTTFGVANVNASPPSQPLNRRTILTWRPDKHGYVPVTPSALTNADTWTSHKCQRYALLNSIHGFSEQVIDCENDDLRPAIFDEWPIGDTVHGGNELLQYSKTCEFPGDKCFAVTVANDGMLHIYDARTGLETAAIIPSEFWRPNTISHHILTQRDDQPTADESRRYLFDGQIHLHHFDNDGNSSIDSHEEAFLITSLGRGGRGYYLFDVSQFSGVPTATRNAPRPLLADETTGFKDLLETWAAPWTGLFEAQPGVRRSVAVISSGHLRQLDAPEAAFAELPAAPPLASTDSEKNPYRVSCTAVGIPNDLCQTPDPASFCDDLGLSCTSGVCSACRRSSVSRCRRRGFAPAYCYDWPGLASLASESVWTRVPIDAEAGPLRYETTDYRGVAYRVNFSRFDLQDGDYIAFFGRNGEELARMGGSIPTSTASPWIYDTSFSLNLVTDGVNSSVALGYTISDIDVVREKITSPVGRVHHPSIFVVDLKRWNQGQDVVVPYNSSDPGLFSGPPIGAEDRQADALWVRITSTCTGITGRDETCIDQNTSAQTADLRWMLCPISAEPAVFSEGGILRSIYVGDECGQIWAAELSNSGEWSVRRILRTNNTGSNGFTIRGRKSKDYRKIFRRLELVTSTCPGRRAVGVYFGTGNIQRPTANDALEDVSVTGLSGSVAPSERNVIGVVWDEPNLPHNASLNDLANVTDLLSIDPTGANGNQNGWYIELRDQERMLRDPLVLDGVAYYDVFQPISSASECSGAVGESRTFVVDNCTAEPLLAPSYGQSPDDARTVSARPDSTIGGGFLVLVPSDKEAIVTLGLDGDGAAALPTRPNSRVLRLFMWRP